MRRFDLMGVLFASMLSITILLTACGGSASSSDSSEDTSGSSGSTAISATANTTAQNLTVGTAMTSFSPLTASGGATPYVFSITSGTLPAGLNLDPGSGEVTGTPTATYAAANVVFSVKDADNVVASTTSTVSFSADLAASVPPSTGWTTVKMGGGGYTPGIIYHPTVNKLRYVRTDMDGVYRWNDSTSQWIPLTDAFPPEDGNHQGAESMAVDPTDASKVYMTTSITVSNGNGRFYYSSDQGDTWNHVDLPFEIGANNQGRGIGERLMVDPNLPSTLFYASRTQGLWKSTDSGLNWSQVTSLSSYKMSASDITNSNGGVLSELSLLCSTRLSRRRALHLRRVPLKPSTSGLPPTTKPLQVSPHTFTNRPMAEQPGRGSRFPRR